MRSCVCHLRLFLCPLEKCSVTSHRCSFFCCCWPTGSSRLLETMFWSFSKIGIFLDQFLLKDYGASFIPPRTPTTLAFSFMWGLQRLSLPFLLSRALKFPLSPWQHIYLSVSKFIDLPWPSLIFICAIFLVLKFLMFYIFLFFDSSIFKHYFNTHYFDLSDIRMTASKSSSGNSMCHLFLLSIVLFQRN